MSNAHLYSGRVVVGVDGSDHCLIAVDWAAEHAARHGLGLTLLTAQEPMTRPVLELLLVDDLDAMLAEAARVILVRAAERVAAAHADLDVSAETVWNAPAPALIEASTRAALVVVSSRGLGGWSGLMLGSVSAGVASHAYCPVMVVPHRMDSHHMADGPVVLGVADSPQGHLAAQFAFAEAETAGASVLALRTWHLGLDWAAALEDRPESYQRLAAHHEELIGSAIAAAAAAHPQVPVERRAVRSGPVAALGEASQEARMLVVGSRGRGTFRGLVLGSTSLGVLQVAHCPVAVVRPVDPHAVVDVNG